MIVTILNISSDGSTKLVFKNKINENKKLFSFEKKDNINSPFTKKNSEFIIDSKANKFYKLKYFKR